MRASAYVTRRIGSSLRRNDGRYLVRGKVSGGHRWPDEPHYWIVDDCRTQTTYHVLVNERPSWARYSEIR